MCSYIHDDQVLANYYNEEDAIRLMILHMMTYQ